jgi:hypothetical protein
MDETVTLTNSNGFHHELATIRPGDNVCVPTGVLDTQSGVEIPQTMPELKQAMEAVDLELASFRLASDVKRARALVVKKRKYWKKYQELYLADLEAKRVPTQSGSERNVYNIDRTQKQQNVAFTDQVDPYMFDASGEMDPTRMLQDSDEATLNNFFSRPIKIHEESWATSSTLGFSINPWKLYFENPRVFNRITNYNLLRARLHLKILINGNGFHYGRAMAYYAPLQVWDDLTNHATLIPETLVQASQMPKVFLDPTTSQGGEMMCPFFYHKNYVNITEAEWDELGELWIRSINPLKHANGGSDTATISVFAWAEDVSVSVLTSMENNLLMAQSGNEVDIANEDGVVSGPSTAVAKAASYFTGIPYIGKFAMATEMAASTVARMARLFGYSRPAITAAPSTYVPRGFGHMAVTNEPDSVQKLTYDSKQELTIDPRIAGIGAADPMEIKAIASRESYLTTFDWSTATAPETLLWNARVDPTTFARNVGNDTYHFPACAMAALPFAYWTGTMKFRFQIVCSSFHKGRIKVVYDPNYLASNEYNTNSLQIIDIADETDFTVEVSNGQELSLLEHQQPGVASQSTMYSTTRYTTKAAGNGVVGVYVVNQLTSPNTTVNNDVQVNVYVSMGDDFEVFAPSDWFARFTVVPQSGLELPVQSGNEVVPESQNTSEPSAPEQSKSMHIGPEKVDLSDLNKVFTGESIVSFRPLLKRYALHTTIGGYFNTEYRNFWETRCLFPYLRGNFSDGIDSTPTLVDTNYCHTLLLHWVALAHQGWRGSIRQKLFCWGRSTANPDGYLSIGMNDSLVTTHVNGVGLAFGLTDEDTLKRFHAPDPAFGSGTYGELTALDTGINGVAMTPTSLNPCLEAEIPFYSRYRFHPGKTSDSHVLSAFERGYSIRVVQDTEASGTTGSYIAAGEDFQVYFWTGLPPLYYSPGLPA